MAIEEEVREAVVELKPEVEVEPEVEAAPREGCPAAERTDRWVPEDPRPFKKLPHPPLNETGDEIVTRNAGIHAVEMYTPRHAVKATELEKAHGVDGKYTSGLVSPEGFDEPPSPISLPIGSNGSQHHLSRRQKAGRKRRINPLLRR